MTNTEALDILILRNYNLTKHTIHIHEYKGYTVETLLINSLISETPEKAKLFSPTKHIHWCRWQTLTLATTGLLVNANIVFPTNSDVFLPRGNWVCSQICLWKFHLWIRKILAASNRTSSFERWRKFTSLKKLVSRVAEPFTVLTAYNLWAIFFLTPSCYKMAVETLRIMSSQYSM